MDYKTLHSLVGERQLKFYLDFAKGDRELAVKYYNANLKASSEFYYVIHWVEVIIRKSVSEKLIEISGEFWFDENTKLGFTEKDINRIERAKKITGKNLQEPTGENISANITFGFWVDIFSPRFKKLWQQKIHEIFKEKLSREDIYRTLFLLKRTRNYIAHYEPIINRPLDDYLKYALKLIAAIDQKSAEEIKEMSEFF